MREYSESLQALLPPQARQYRTLRIVFIKPSQYDDDGYVIRFWKGVLPSNTLSVLRGLTEDVERRGVLGDIAIRLDTFDEVAQKVPVRQIMRWSRQSDTKLVVCLVGVQTPQFPRALDFGKQFRAHGIDVIVGDSIPAAPSICSATRIRIFRNCIGSRSWSLPARLKDTGARY
ncbi:MAG: hypothetical protein M5R38_14195 [Candidatus Methylomirabilis sp.]|nr:hypothetical protein [Candidatus Methylomirabilis sp.]